MNAARKPYPSDLCDEQWAIIEPLVPEGLPGGRPLKSAPAGAPGGR